MEKDTDRRPEHMEKYAAETTTLLGGIPPFKLRWVGFINTVAACLVTTKGALIPCIGIECPGRLTIWTFYVLVRDDRNATIQLSFTPDMIPTMISSLDELATPSDRYATQLLVNFLGESGLISSEYVAANHDTLRKLPYFMCNTHADAYAQLRAWRDTDESKQLLWRRVSSKRVPDYGAVEREPEKKKKEKVDVPEEEDEFECMICMDAPPTTRVLPCGHVVVCSTCSVRLRDTADESTCVRCRTPIESVEDLKTGKITSPMGP